MNTLVVATRSEFRLFILGKILFDPDSCIVYERAKNFKADYPINFKSEEIREQYFEIMKSMTADDIRKNMKNENANFQMNWNNEKNDMVMYCWWKANSPQAILDTLGDMAAMFDNNIKEMSNVMDVTG